MRGEKGLTAGNRVEKKGKKEVVEINLLADWMANRKLDSSEKAWLKSVLLDNWHVSESKWLKYDEFNHIFYDLTKEGFVSMVILKQGKSQNHVPQRRVPTFLSPLNQPKFFAFWNSRLWLRVFGYVYNMSLSPTLTVHLRAATFDQSMISYNLSFFSAILSTF